MLSAYQDCTVHYQTQPPPCKSQFGSLTIIRMGPTVPSVIPTDFPSTHFAALWEDNVSRIPVISSRSPIRHQPVRLCIDSRLHSKAPTKHNSWRSDCSRSPMFSFILQKTIIRCEPVLVVGPLHLGFGIPSLSSSDCHLDLLNGWPHFLGSSALLFRSIAVVGFTTLLNWLRRAQNVSCILRYLL